MKYKGYTGKVVFDEESDFFHGEVIDTKDIITFQGENVVDLKAAFKDSVDDYLDFCAERGEKPEKPFSGKFVIRISPELHHSLYVKAVENGESINTVVEHALEVAN
jgi:predicted HicB family RNase H-like nuclease